MVDSKPDRCRRCGEALAGDDPEPLVRQVFEVPVVKPRVVEHRLHRLACPRCGASSCGRLPGEAELGYGPRTQAACAVLSGERRLSKRRVADVLRGLFGLPIGPAAIRELERRTAAALDPIHVEALAHVRNPAANVDETGRREGRRRGWLWAAVAAGRGRDAFEDLMGRSPTGVVKSDPFSAYAHLPAERRQAVGPT